MEEPAGLTETGDQPFVAYFSAGLIHEYRWAA